MFRRFRQQISGRVLRISSLGLIDQSILSGVNFLFMIAAARALGPVGFGFFALLFMVIGFVEACQASLVTSPHNVIGASKSEDEYRHYTGSVASIQVGLVVVFGALIGVAAAIAVRFDTAIASMLIALAFAAAGFQCQEFVRRVLYTELRVGAAMVNDAVTHGLRLAMLGALVLRYGVTGSRLFLILGASCFTGAILGLWQIRDSLTPAFDSRVIREHWKFGGWLVAGRAFSHAPRYAAAAVLSATLSVGAFGAFRAAHQLVRATSVPLNALDSVLRPRLARDANVGPHAVWNTLLPIMVLGGMVFSLFAAVLIILRRPLLDFVYGSEFAGYAAVMFILAFTPLATLPERLFSNALQAVRLTRPFFTAKLAGAVVGTSLGSAAVVLLGLPAAGAIFALTAITSACWLAWTWKRCMEDEKEWMSTPDRVPEASVVRRPG